MQVTKWVQIKLFYNLSNHTHYVQIGENLFIVKTTVALALQDKEGLEIRHGKELKDIQIMSLEDEKSSLK